METTTTMETRTDRDNNERQRWRCQMETMTMESFFHTAINLMVSYIWRQHLEMMMETVMTMEMKIGDDNGDPTTTTVEKEGDEGQWKAMMEMINGEYDDDK